MKEFMPSTVVQPAASGKVTTVGAARIGQKGAETAVSGGFSADSSHAGRSFLASFESLLASGATQQVTAEDGVASGNALPLAVSAAISGQAEPSALPLDQGLLDPGAVNGRPTASQMLQQDADNAATGAFSDMSKLIARTPPLQPLNAAAQNGVSQPKAADQTILQAEQTLNKLVNPIPADASVARMQHGLPEAETGRDQSRLGAVQALELRDTADVQTSTLKTESLRSETDQLFTSRIQLAMLNQTAELAAQKHAFETLVNNAQTGTSEALQASLARAPMSQTITAADAQSTSAQTMITETFGKPEWGQGMGKQILWLVNQNINRAEIRMNPANLGPIEVRIDLDNDQVNVAFTSRHAEVREAVEQALPRLREMLEERGLNLADTDVSQHSFAEQQQQAFAQAGEHHGASTVRQLFEADEALPLDAVQSRMNGAAHRAGEGLVDYYI